MGMVLDLTKGAQSHPSEEILEEYLFLRLPETLAAPIEEHLLVCQDCQDKAVATAQFISAIKDMGRQPAADLRPRPGWLSGFAANKTSLVPVLILAVVAILAVRKHAQEPVTAVPVTLSSLRGAEALSPAPAGKPLKLHIQSPDLAQDLANGREYRVEVVDDTGDAVWKGAVTKTDGKLMAMMLKPLQKGVYWVRLYGTGSEPLREFGLSAK